MIATDNLSVRYGSTHALVDATVNIPTGGTSAIIGPNGSGKSTLLKGMLGLVPSTGTVRADTTAIGYMPQAAAVDWDFPARVREVVLMGTYGRLRLGQRPGRAEKQVAAHAMELTGIADLAERQIGALSGGQRQRVFLARMLAQQPDLLMMDEPFAGIDAASEASILEVLAGLEDVTIVIVHHNLATVRRICDHAIILSEGRVQAQGPAHTTLTTEIINEAYGFEVAR